MSKIDVCVVTKNDRLPKGLENIPIKNLIIETSSPIGRARQNAIKKVSTEIFAFIDDDIIISENWFRIMSKFMEDDEVGAVFGICKHDVIGKFNKYIFPQLSFQFLGPDDRLYTNDTLIKTELVKDWVCGEGRLYCYEDLDIGQYIMNQGKKILFIPTDTIHKKSLMDIYRGGVWSGSNWRRAYKPTKFKVLKQYLRRSIAPFWCVFSRGIFVSIVNLIRDVGFIIGMLKYDLRSR